MPQPTPPPTPSPLPLSPSGPDEQDRPSAGEGERERRQDEQLAALRQAIPSGLAVVALLGQHDGFPGGWGSAAYLIRDGIDGELIVAALNERVSSPGTYDVTLWRELDETLPGPPSWCPQCGATVEGWTRYCSCGTDLSGIAAGTDEELEQFLEHARQATAGEFELFGALPYAAGGGLAYFARQNDQNTIVALRMHADGTFDDGTPRISLSISEPCREVGTNASIVVGRSPHSGPVRFTPVDSISVVTDETAARQAVSGPEKKRRSPQGFETPLPPSILGSGLLAQQPTPSGQEAVAVAKVCPQCGAEYDTASRFCPNDGTPLRPKGSTDPYVGQILADRYHILKRLGEGGMGKVYLAEHVKMNRQCAVKVMNSALVNDAESAQRFAREASNAARIIHPNVAAVFDYGESDGVVYLVMEYVDGEPLTRILERETVLSPHRAVDVARQVAEALVAAHELGIVHRDLKPDNIIVASGKNGREISKVVDFGIAKAVEESPTESLTRTGLVIGTPEYMSPEQLLGDPVDSRSDVYSLGCILYQMLTSRRPFDEPTREQMIKRRLTEKAPHARDLIPDLPKTLDLIVARMLARSPHDRYGTAAEVRDLLIPAIALEGGFDDPSWRPQTRSNPTVFIQAAEQPTQEMTPHPAVAAQRPLWRRPSLVGGFAVAVIALGATATILTRNAISDRRSARATDRMAVKPNPATSVQFILPPPTVAPLLPTKSAGASAAAKSPDSALSTTASTSTVPAELRAPIEELARAIETGLEPRVQQVYKAYEDDKETKTYWNRILGASDSIRVKSVSYKSYTITGNVADLKFSMSVSYMANGSKVPVADAVSTWLAKLVRDGKGLPWKIQHLRSPKL
jgi:serine/threonine-protein kinase